MKNLLACLAMLAAFNVSAQTETSNFPYNPDVNGDGFIGVNDLVSFLSFYDAQFSLSAQMNVDSTSAILFPPNWESQDYYFLSCKAVCDSLPGPWTVLSSNGYASHLGTIRDSISAQSLNYMGFWRSDWGSMQPPSNSSNAFLPSISFYLNSNTSNPGAYESYREITQTQNCLCELRQRQRVEYDYCAGTIQSIKLCATTKSAAGWYPLSLNGQGIDWVQTFWRWAD